MKGDIAYQIIEININFYVNQEAVVDTMQIKFILNEKRRKISNAY